MQMHKVVIALVSFSLANVAASVQAKELLRQ